MEREKSFRPFHTEEDTDPILKAAPNVMNQNLHRLLLEDFMMLNPDDNVISFDLIICFLPVQASKYNEQYLLHCLRGDDFCFRMNINKEKLVCPSWIFPH